jgi:spore coat protein A
MKKFLSLAVVFLTVGGILAAGTPACAQFVNSPPLQKFIQPLRNLQVFDPNGIPVAEPDGKRFWPGVVATHYTIDIGQFEDRLHPQLPNTTRLWGFGQKFSAASPHNWTRHLGGIIVAEKGHPVQITFRNRLTADGKPHGAPLAGIIPVDTSIPGANQAQNRTAVHAHGGFVPWISDGGPFDWWAPDGDTGLSFRNNEVLRPGQKVPPNEAEYYYPNDQSARFVWYHDHAFGLTRLNAYAGIASAYVITDWYEKLLSFIPFNIPDAVDPRTLYLVFQDKIFYNGTNDPGYAGVVPGVKAGDLWYNYIYDRWDGANGQPIPSVIPEFFGDTILVNGTVYPTVTLEQREYRLRMLNACNARFLNPRIVKASAADLTEPETYNNPATAAQFVQIGNEGGYLPYPVRFNTAALPNLLLAPAERADLIVDLRNATPGTYILYNDAPGPYPSGDPANDYYPGNPDTPSATAGVGPNTRTLLQIVVKARTGAANRPVRIPPFFTPTDPFLVFQKPGVPNPVPAPDAQTMQLTVLPFKKVTATVRHLTLNEDVDEFGRLIQYLGTNVAPGNTGGFGRKYLDTPTEVVNKGAYEIWEIANLSADTHPIHIHLVNAMVLARRNFDPNNYNGTPIFTGNAIAPDANELGWKETIRMNPAQVTWLLMKFDLPKVPFKVPTSTRFTGGADPVGVKYHEYVWHCHILEHEEHDMMRPLVVVE